MKTIAKAGILLMFIAVAGFVLLAPTQLLSEVLAAVARVFFAVLITAFGFYIATREKE